MVFCAVKRGDAQKTQEPGDTVDGPLCDLATEPAPVQPTTVPQDPLKDSVSMGAKMIQELKDRVRELEELLSESHRNSEIKSKRFDEKYEAYSKLKSEYNDLKKTVMQNQELLKEFERECEAHSNLQVEYDKLKITAMHNEELLQEFERGRDAHRNLQVKFEKLKITAMHNEELLQSSLAKAKQEHQEAIVYIDQLEDEKDDLSKEVEALRETVEDLGNLLSETNKDYDELIEECERERKAHSIIQSQYEELKKTVICNEEILKASLAKAEQKHQEAMKSIAQLENENTNEVETLRETVEDLGNLLCETSRDCDKLTEECERERTAHSKLLSQLDKLKLTVICREEVLKSSLAQTEQKHQEYIALLEGENASLINKVKTLRETVEDLGNLLSESNRNCDELMRQGCERDREAHSNIQSQYEELKKTVMHHEEMLKALWLKLSRNLMRHDAAPDPEFTCTFLISPSPPHISTSSTGFPASNSKHLCSPTKAKLVPRFPLIFQHCLI